MYDVAVLGGGPGGVAAGVYAGRKKLKTVFLTDNFGGQSIVSDEVRNWIGIPSIPGLEIAKKLKEHLEEYKDVIDIKEGELATKISKNGETFVIETGKGKYEAKTVILTTGSRRRRMGVPGEDKFEGKGVVYCSTCDAPLFRDRNVAVIGGGNAGVEAVIDLLPYAKSIKIFDRNEKLKADPGSVQRIKKEDKVEIIYSKQPLEVQGENLVSGLVVEDVKTKEKTEVPIEGVFVEIGSVPNSELVKDLAELNQGGEVLVDCMSNSVPNVPGLFAAGDVTNVKYKQNNISMGDGIKALLSAYQYLLAKEVEEQKND